MGSRVVGIIETGRRNREKLSANLQYHFYDDSAVTLRAPDQLGEAGRAPGLDLDLPNQVLHGDDVDEGNEPGTPRNTLPGSASHARPAGSTWAPVRTLLKCRAPRAEVRTA